MAEFRAFAQGVEVSGQTVYSVVDGMGVFRNTALAILAENGIPEPRAGAWYSQQAWLDSFRAISAKIGRATLLLIGQKIPENADFPPAIDSLEKALQAIDVAYHMNHRRAGEVLFDQKTGRMQEGIGHYSYTRVDDHHARMLCRNPYPCEFDRGIIDAMARRFKPAGTVAATVTHDDSAPCRRNGAESCTYLVGW